MKINSLFILLIVLIIGIAACSDSDFYDIQCEASEDTIVILDELKIDDISYHLVLRVIGWHDKTEILELYNQPLNIDQCDNIQAEPVFGQSLEQEGKVSHVYLNFEKNILDIRYIAGESSMAHNSSIRLKLKPKQ